MGRHICLYVLSGLFWLVPTGPVRGQASDPAKPETDAVNELKQLKREIKELRSKQKELIDRQEAIEEEMEAAEDASAEASEVNQQRTFMIYGFFDVVFQQFWLPEAGLVRFVGDDRASFVFGNLNLYFDFNPLPDWRFLTEIRFLLNPLGDVASYKSSIFGTRFERVNTTTMDPTNLREEFEYGAIEIERAQLEWAGVRWLNVTLGLFLTPYGIWNEDHGSPTLLTVESPPVYSSYLGAFPERQLGVKLHGSFLWEDFQLAYDLTLSNGRGATDLIKDSNWDKAVGARLEVSYSGSWSLKMGFSGYTGEVTESVQSIEVNSEIIRQLEITAQYRETAMAIDLQFEMGPFQLQGEVLFSWRAYDDDHRPPAAILGSFSLSSSLFPSDLGIFASGGYAPDRMAWGTYLLASYRLPIESLNIRPYFMFGWVDFDDTFAGENAISIAAGINWRISGAIVLKAEYFQARWPNSSPDDSLLFVASGPLNQLVLQVAVAF
jgi:hypothetical protein